MGRVTQLLREWARETSDEEDVIAFLESIADEIDAEHERRMERCRRETRRAACRYLGSVLEDYKHGAKRRNREDDE